MLLLVLVLTFPRDWNIYIFDTFINETIRRAQRYGWIGFSVDFEPDSFVDSYKLTNFILKWAKQLSIYNLSLSVWIGGPTQYNMDMLFNSTIVNIVTMSTYTTNYQNFIGIAGSLQTLTMNTSKLGFNY